jgi:hypothetical protein
MSLLTELWVLIHRLATNMPRLTALSPRCLSAAIACFSPVFDRTRENILNYRFGLFPNSALHFQDGELFAGVEKPRPLGCDIAILTML